METKEWYERAHFVLFYFPIVQMFWLLSELSYCVKYDIETFRNLYGRIHHNIHTCIETKFPKTCYPVGLTKNCASVLHVWLFKVEAMAFWHKQASTMQHWFPLTLGFAPTSKTSWGLGGIQTMLRYLPLSTQQQRVRTLRPWLLALLSKQLCLHPGWLQRVSPLGYETKH